MVEERGTRPPVVEIEPPAARNCRIGGEDGVSRRVYGRSPVSLATKAARIAVDLGGVPGQEPQDLRATSSGTRKKE
jgi:hypothetical protein